ncbi:MAG: glycoside hydrolase family 5 protein [Planctomycetes bacterium]|nr:glycoside hydrolase family 5 protein [Planctomycetota bacterium]
MGINDGKSSILKYRWLLSLGIVVIAVVGLKLAPDNASREPVRYTALVRDVPPLRGVMSPTRDLTEKDLEDLAKWNVNLVRFQIMRNWLQKGTDRDIPEYDAWFDSRLDNLESMLPVARRLGIRFVLDCHTQPGGRAADNSMCMFDEEEYGEHFIAVWKRIASRFRNHPDKEALWAYDLLNEPIESPAAARRGAAEKLLLRAAEAIREIDPDSVIIVPSLNQSGPADFAKLKPLPLENIVYQAHMYLPFTYTPVCRSRNHSSRQGKRRVSRIPRSYRRRDVEQIPVAAGTAAGARFSASPRRPHIYLRIFRHCLGAQCRGLA